MLLDGRHKSNLDLCLVVCLFPFIRFLVATDFTVRAALAQVIPDIFAKCIELANTDVELCLFDPMLKALLGFLKTEENAVSMHTVN